MKKWRPGWIRGNNRIDHHAGDDGRESWLPLSQAQEEKAILI